MTRGRIFDAATPEEEERYKRVVADRVDNSPYYRLIGIEVIGLSPGRSRLRLKAGRELHNLGGIVHGGALTSLADAAAGVALATLLDKDRERPMTVELKVNFCSPAIEEELIAEGNVVNLSLRLNSLGHRLNPRFPEQKTLILRARSVRPYYGQCLHEGE